MWNHLETTCYSSFNYSSDSLEVCVKEGMGDGEPSQLEVETEVEAEADSDVNAFAIDLSTFPPLSPTQNLILLGSMPISLLSFVQARCSSFL